jgi:hypothetical protein
MEEIKIPGDATYSPVALTDILVAAPLVSRVILGATFPGRVIQAAAFGYYAGSSVKDWVARSGVRKIEFEREYDADVFKLESMPEDARHLEMHALTEALNDGYDARRIPREELAREVNRHLTSYIASVTGQRVETSSEIRSFSIAMLVFPFAYGACDVISGDVAIFKDTGIFEPHIIAHEFTHRKGYFKELHAQAISYLAMRNSGNPILVQSARAERLHRQLRSISGEDPKLFAAALGRLDLRPELQASFRALRPEPSSYESAVSKVMKRLYEERMKLTGQNGLSDYDVGFTNFLYTFSRSTSARQPGDHAGI